MKISLVPVNEYLEENVEFQANPLCHESLAMTCDFYTRVGFHKPWIGYYAKSGDQLVGCAAFVGRPVNGTVEIAYGTFEPYRSQGVATAICGVLVDLALQTDPTLRVTAHTLREENYSTRVLRKNNFFLAGTIYVPEDGDVWEWEYQGPLLPLQQI
jgi:ribosomal-protein-alanine N-acetyltransferase